MYLFKFLKFYYNGYKLLKYQNKIEEYIEKKEKLENILNLGFASEKHFNSVMRDKWNAMKLKDGNKKVNVKAKKRLQELAGIKITETDMTKFQNAGKKLPTEKEK